MKVRINIIIIILIISSYNVNASSLGKLTHDVVNTALDLSKNVALGLPAVVAMNTFNICCKNKFNFFSLSRPIQSSRWQKNSIEKRSHFQISFFL